MPYDKPILSLKGSMNNGHHQHMPVNIRADQKKRVGFNIVSSLELIGSQLGVNHNQIHFADAFTIRFIQERREQNRKAQYRFRQRRKAADVQQEDRIKLLEDALHETLSLFIALSDTVVSIDFFSIEYPNVLSDLQRTMARILEIAKTVEYFKKVSANSSIKSPAVASEKERRSLAPEAPSAELPSSLSSSIQSCPARLRTIEVESPPSSSMIEAIGLVKANGMNQGTTTNDLWSPTLFGGSLEFQSKPTYQIPSPQCRQLMLQLNSFASKLVEITLSRAYSLLFTSESVSSEDVYRTFGSTLRIRTREQILFDLRWLLGPGKKALPHASGYLWKQSIQKDAPTRRASYSSLDEVCLEVDSDAEIDYKSSVNQPKHLTTLGVLQELANLRARVIDNDTLEIILDEQRSVDSMRTRMPVASDIGNMTILNPSNARFDNSPKELLRLKLSVPLLTVNLALAATCAKTGPVYSRNDVAKAVEAAIIMVGKNP